VRVKAKELRNQECLKNKVLKRKKREPLPHLI